MEIRYVNHSIGNNFGSFIELNENLKKYPKLHDAILAHELDHTDIEGFNKKDFLLDISENRVSTWDIFKFMVNHPKAFMQFSPVTRRDNTVYYDTNAIVTFLGALVIGGVVIYLLL